jgi:SAM-dependent methyltransferase
MNIVDLGCKSLSLLIELEKLKVRCNYHGVDISEVALNKLGHSFINKPKISVCDVMDGIPFINSESADRVFCLELIEHVNKPIFLLQEIQRILKPGGLAIVSCPNPYYWVNIFNSIFKIQVNEGHISSFRWQEIKTLSEFVGLKLIASKKTFATFPPLKSKFYIYPKALIGLCSESTQFIFAGE